MSVVCDGQWWDTGAKREVGEQEILGLEELGVGLTSVM